VRSEGTKFEALQGEDLRYWGEPRPTRAGIEGHVIRREYRRKWRAQRKGFDSTASYLRSRALPKKKFVAWKKGSSEEKRLMEEKEKTRLGLKNGGELAGEEYNPQRLVGGLISRRENSNTVQGRFQREQRKMCEKTQNCHQKAIVG